MKPLAPNTLLQNRYLIVQLIGKGGMGEVYLGVDQRLGSAMAIKRTFFSDDETLMMAFEREAKTLARLRHPVLPKVSDHFNENDIQYLVMEHISGDDLSKRLELTNQPFPLNWVLFWADQLLDALAYLHSYEPPIIHRDIKPQNLKLTNENHIILLDFGLAKNSSGGTRLTTSGSSIVGYTPHYASMEQIRGTGTTARSDIYSLSATLYQLLTNTVPPDALSRADSVLNGLPDPVKPLNELNPEVSQPISAVILKGMHLSADQRYPGAREMQKALRDAYAQMQQVMSAQTIAFNINDVEQAGSSSVSVPEVPQPLIPAQQFSTPAVSQHAGETEKSASYGGFSSNNTGTGQILPPPENFDATIPYNLPVTGEKTEILPTNSPSAAPDSFGNNKDSIAQSFDKHFDKSFDKQEESYNPENTAAFISYGDSVSELPPDANQTAVNFISLPKNDSNTETGTRENSTAPRTEVPPPVVAKTEVGKKSGSKTMTIVGGIIGLAFIGLIAAGVIIYALNPTMFSAATPTPVPTAEPTIAPTIEPTVEPALQADTNVNSNTDSSNPLTATTADNTNTENTNTEMQVVAENTPRPQDARTASTTRAVPNQKTLTQPRGEKVPASKATPPPAKVPDRTRIL